MRKQEGLEIWMLSQGLKWQAGLTSPETNPSTLYFMNKSTSKRR